MKKALLLTILAIVFSGYVMAQKDTSYTAPPKKKGMALIGGDGFYNRDSTWKIGGFIGFNVAQTALYQWAPGGTNSLSMLFAASAYANYKKGKLSWCTNLDLKYGMVAVGLVRDGQAEKNLQKNIDVLQLSTNVGYDITDHLYFSGKLGFLSQFSPTYDYSQTDTAGGQFKRYVVSRFAAPAVITLGPGFTWKPTDYFTMFFTPIEGKITVVTGQQKDTLPFDSYYTGVDPTRFGLQAGTNYMAQLGAEIDILFQKDIVKNVNWKSHLNVFESYSNNNYNTIVPFYYSAQDSMGTINISKKTQFIPTMTWDNDIVCKINKILSATLSTRFIYQYNAQTPVAGSNGLTEVDKFGKTVLSYNKLQIFEQFGIGLAVKF